MLAHVPSFGRNPRGSTDFLAYPVPKACMHVLGTGVPRCLGVARSASSPKAAQALGCSLTPGLRISFGRVTCMARAASVPGLWTLGFLLLRGARVWVWVVVGFGFRLRPATPGWGVAVCVCLRVRSACTLPLLAGVCGVGVCGWVPVPAAPRHSWLGCRGLCLLVCALRLHPATPGWGVRRGYVCLGSGFGCAPPLLAGVLGRVCACVRAPLVPRPSWLGRAPWVCVLGLGFRLRPDTPGWGVGVCLCLSARSTCTPPLLAGVCGGGVCVWARVSPAPRHSWLGCWAVCVLVLALRLHPATPGWGAHRGCVCLSSGFGCAPLLLAGVLGCVCAGVGAPLATRHSWLGCAPWVCVFGLGSQLRPATPGWGVGVCVCWCGRSACTPPLLAGVRAMGVCVWARVSAAPRHSWLGCWGVCVLVCVPPLYPATPGWGVRWVCVCLGSGFGCTPPLLAGVLDCVSAGVGAPLAPRHSWLGRGPCMCVFGLGFRLCPATPGWGVGVCVCWCGRSACTPPLLAGVRAVGVCVWARVSAAPRHSWLGFWGVCVLVWALRLPPATPGWGVRWGCVCLGPGLGCAPLLLAGVLGCVCAGVGAPLATRHSWLGRAPWVCVFGLGFQLRPATPGWAVGLCVCWCGRSACSPPLLAGVRAVGVCVWARVSAAPRHSWLGCWGVCVLVWALRLHPATPGWGVRWGCVCLGSGLGSAPLLLAGVLGCVCAGVGAPLAARHSWLGCAPWVCVFGLGFRLRPATAGWGVGVCVCSCACPPCYPPLLAGVCGGCVCVWARVSAAPRHSWLGCAVGVCVFGLRFRLHPATPGWGFGLCVCWCGRSACTPPLLAGPRAVHVCVWARVSAVPRHSWLGCWAVCLLVWALRLHPATPGWGARRGCVCLGSGFGCAPPLLAGVLGCVCARVHAPLVPRHSWLGCAVGVCVFGLGFRLHPATPGWGVGLCVCWCGRCACTLPLLAGPRAVHVCVWARVLAVPRHSWLGCWAVCLLVWALRLHPATPGWGARRGCVCLGSGFGCAPPLLAGLFGCVCARVGAPLATRHSWLGCAVGVCVFGVGFRLRPVASGWDVGLCVCWCGRSACNPPLLAWVRAVGVCVLARVSAAPRHSWLGCWGVCVLVWALRLHPATPGWGARRGGVCLGSGFGCAPPLLAGVLGCVCARVRAPLVPRHSWLGCAVAVCVCLGSGFGCSPPLLAGVLGCVSAGVGAPLAPRHSWLGRAPCMSVFGLGFRLCPATLGWGVGLCVCWCRRSACTPPLLAGVRAVGVCVWARVSAAPRHSWLGCWGVCVLVWALRLHPATPGWAARRGCVCLGLGFGFALPLLAGVLGCVCAGVGAPLAPRHFWLGRAP